VSDGEPQECFFAFIPTKLSSQSCGSAAWWLGTPRCINDNSLSQERKPKFEIP